MKKILIALIAAVALGVVFLTLNATWLKEYSPFVPGFMLKSPTLDDISFVVRRDSLLLGQLFTTKDYPGEEVNKIYQTVSQKMDEGKMLFVDFPPKYYGSYLKYNNGTIVRLLSSHGIQKSRIERQGLILNWGFILPCGQYKPVNFKPGSYDFGQTMIALPPGYTYKGKIIRFREYSSDDSSFKQEMNRIASIALEWRNPMGLTGIDHYPNHMIINPGDNTDLVYKGGIIEKQWGQKRNMNGIAVTAFAVDYDINPDTLLVLASFANRAVYFCFTAVFKAEKVDGSWTSTCLSNANFGPPMTKIDCAFDFDNDAKLEYLLISPMQTCDIYSWVDYRLKRVRESVTFGNDNIKY